MTEAQLELRAIAGQFVNVDDMLGAKGLLREELKTYKGDVYIPDFSYEYPSLAKFGIAHGKCIQVYVVVNDTIWILRRPGKWLERFPHVIFVDVGTLWPDVDGFDDATSVGGSEVVR
jgi:hypothetical protein